MACSTPGLPVPHHLPEFAQVHVHCIGDAVQPSHPLMLFSFSPQSFLGQLGHLFTSDDQNTGVPASVSVFPVSIQGWSPLRWTGLISLLSSVTVRRHQFFGVLYSPALTTIPDHWEDHCFDIRTFVSRVMSLLFNTLSRFAIAFLPRGNGLLISWLQSLSTVILEPKKRKSVTTSTFSPSVCHVTGLMAWS